MISFLVGKHIHVSLAKVKDEEEGSQERKGSNPSAAT